MGTAASTTDLGRLAGGPPRPAGSGPVAHPLHVFFRVVAVAVAVAQGRRKETPRLALPQPFDRDTELAGGFRDPIRCASMLFHGISIINDTKLRYWYFSVYRFRCQGNRLPMTTTTAPEVCLQVHLQHLQVRQVATDESGAMPFAPCLAIRVPAATIAEPSRARSSVGRAPPSHGGGQGFESPRVHSSNLFRSR
jgi:hypothetical protein